MFVDRLPADQQRVAEGLAALGIPAGTEAVIGILEPYVPAPRIEPALRALVAAGLVLEVRDGRRYLRKSETEAVLSRLAAGDRQGDEGEPLTRRVLLVRAAKVLRGMQKDDDNVHGLADLHAHFARVDVWLRAGLYDSAYSVIEAMEELVDRWGSGTELRTQREAVRGRLGDERGAETANLAALGDIYSYGGDFASARSAYRTALKMAQEDRPDARWKAAAALSRSPAAGQPRRCVGQPTHGQSHQFGKGSLVGPRQGTARRAPSRGGARVDICDGSGPTAG